MFPDVARFVLLLVAGACVLLGVSHLLWEIAVTRVRPALDQFQSVAIVELRPPSTNNTSVSGAVMPVPAASRAPGAASATTGATGAAPGAGAGAADQAPAAPPIAPTPAPAARSGSWSAPPSNPQSAPANSPAAPTVEAPANAALVVRTVVPAQGGTR
jgi:hypothetical protein